MDANKGRPTMYTEIQLRQFEGEVAAILPIQMLERHGLSSAARALAIETEEGILIVGVDSSTGKALQIAAKGSEKYRDALKRLGG